MNRHRAFGKHTGVLMLLALLTACLVATTATTQAQAPQDMADILKAPQNYWNKTVVVKGKVTKVTPNPAGSTRGSYVCRDANGKEITIITSLLPAVGEERTVTGTVGQETPASLVPVVYDHAGPGFPMASGTSPMLDRSMPPGSRPGPTSLPMMGANALPPPTPQQGFSPPVLVAIGAVSALLVVGLIVAVRRRLGANQAGGRRGTR